MVFTLAIGGVYFNVQQDVKLSWQVLYLENSFFFGCNKNPMFPVSTKMTSGRLLLLLPLTLSIRPCGSDIIPTVSSSVTPPDASTRASLTSPRPGTQITSILRTPQTPTLTPYTLLHLQTINSHLSLQNMLWLFCSPLSCHQVKIKVILFIPGVVRANANNFQGQYCSIDDMFCIPANYSKFNPPLNPPGRDKILSQVRNLEKLHWEIKLKLYIWLE